MSDTTLLSPPTPAPATPPPTRRPSRLASLLVSLGLVAVVVGYLGGPGLWQWDVANHRHTMAVGNVVKQVTNIVAPPTDTGLVARLSAAPTSPQAAPLIITYHDIGYGHSPQTVTPQAFAAQMQLLRDAGWSTGTARQLDDWLAGRPWPAHTVMVTFDDGARGVWQFADQILARNGQHATAYIITGFVGTHAPYYMTWPEITALNASGRWDIEAHTHLGHVQVQADAAGHQAPFLTTLEYLPAQRRTETIDEYKTRISADLAESKRQLVGHGIPEPDFFAYPFSAHEGFPNGTYILTNTVQSLFKASMLDQPDEVATTTTANLATHELARMDITGDVSVATWVQRLTGASPLDPAAVRPLSMPSAWTADFDVPVTLPTVNDSIALDPGPGRYTERRFAPLQTTLWRDYTARATVGGLGSQGSGATASLIALTDDPQQVSVDVSAGLYDVIQGTAPHEQHRSGVLPGSGPYNVEIDVRPGTLTVIIDGKPVQQIPLHGQGLVAPAGGIAISAYRHDPQSPIPTISGVTAG